MKTKPNVKEHIIEATISLIENSGGDTNGITARRIAERANIGLGLINYHFGSKEQLITACVQRIIGNVVAGFKTERQFESDKARLTAVATHVFHFLFEHPAISKISILGDLHSYTADSNSVHTQQGFAYMLRQEIADDDKPMLAFVLTGAMQIAFLGHETVKELFGYDLTRETDRAAYIERLVTLLFEDNRKGVIL